MSYIEMKTPREIMDSKISEKDFQKQVLELLTLYKWDFVYHVFETGTRIACPRCDFLVSGHYARRIGEGFPDILAGRVADKRILVAELKSETGKVTEAQETWLNFFHFIGWETYIWRPHDWDRLLEIAK